MYEMEKSQEFRTSSPNNGMGKTRGTSTKRSEFSRNKKNKYWDRRFSDKSREKCFRDDRNKKERFRKEVKEKKQIKKNNRLSYKKNFNRKKAKYKRIFIGHNDKCFILIPVKTKFFGLFLNKESKRAIRNFVMKNEFVFKGFMKADGGLNKFVRGLYKFHNNLYNKKPYRNTDKGCIVNNIPFMFCWLTNNVYNKRTGGTKTYKQLYFGLNASYAYNLKSLNPIEDARKARYDLTVNINPNFFNNVKIDKLISDKSLISITQKQAIMVRNFSNGRYDFFNIKTNVERFCIRRSIDEELFDKVKVGFDVDRLTKMKECIIFTVDCCN